MKFPAVNHYERLKVSRDAPPEVIRAAYRALATKVHPDRSGAKTGPDDDQHAQMAALNTAYETLMDARARQVYDDALDIAGPADTGRASTFGPSERTRRSERDSEPNGERTRGRRKDADADEDANGPSTRVDMDWLTPRAADTRALWPPSPRLAMAGGGVGLLVLLGLLGWLWQMWGQHQMERALSHQYASRPPAVAEAAMPPDLLTRQAAGMTPEAAAPRPLTMGRAPTVDELARMSDEELLSALPALDGTMPAATSRMPSLIVPARDNRPHPLDGGAPLSLRADQDLVDPLAP